MPAPLTPILTQLRAEPSRTWSIVITIFGDAIVPRGGSVWLGTLLEICKGMDIAGGVVRTAMSRLGSDGWVERTRIGRNSFYSLTQTSRATVAAASDRIYGQPPSDWDGRFRLLLAPSDCDRESIRPVLERSGLGAIAPGVWVAPASAPLPPEAARLMRLDSETDHATGRQLVEQAWSLQRTAKAYEHFLHIFRPFHQWLSLNGSLSGFDALIGRLLLVHQYRRALSRDPFLPPPLLPTGWPGTNARQLCADIYDALLAPSEHWLDQNGRNESGFLPPATTDLRQRFATPRPGNI